MGYDTRIVDAEYLEDELEALCLPPKPAARGKGKPVSRAVNKATKVGMVTTLTASLAYGYLGNKKAHIRLGQVFVALAGMHMLRHQSTLLR